MTAEIADSISSKAFDVSKNSIASQADGFKAQVQQVFNETFSAIGETCVAVVFTLNEIALALVGLGGAFGAFGTDIVKFFKSVPKALRKALIQKIIPALFSTQAASAVASGSTGTLLKNYNVWTSSN